MKNRTKTFFSLFVSALVCFSVSSSANAVIYKHRWSGKYLNVAGNPGSNTSVIRGVTLYSGNNGSNLTTDPEQKWNQGPDYLKSFAYPLWCLNRQGIAPDSPGEAVSIYGCISPPVSNLQGFYQSNFTGIGSTANGRQLAQLVIRGYGLKNDRCIEPARVGSYFNGMTVNFYDCYGKSNTNQDWEVWN
jgi:hypothetical protein